MQVASFFSVSKCNLGKVKILLLLVNGFINMWGAGDPRGAYILYCLKSTHKTQLAEETDR